MTLIAARPPRKHGSALYVRGDLKVKSVTIRDERNVEFITVELPGVVVHSVYKPPTFLLPALGHRNLPHFVIGDFNSHRTIWAYTTTDNNGESAEHLAEANNQTFIRDAKPPKSLNSKRWKIGYNPDLILASTSIGGMCEKKVLEPIRLVSDQEGQAPVNSRT